MVQNEPMIDRTRFEALAASDRDLTPDECAALAEVAAALVGGAEGQPLDEASFELLWRNDHSEAWLNRWWEPRDTGYHDHAGSCVGVYVLAGVARNESLAIGGARRVREYGSGASFSFPGTGIHRMEHEPGAVTVHVYSPPIRAIGHYDLVDGELHRRSGPPDEASPPSPGLTAVLAPPGGRASRRRRARPRT